MCIIKMLLRNCQVCETRDSAVAEGPRDDECIKGEMLSGTTQLHKKSYSKRLAARIAVNMCINSPVFIYV